MERKPDRMTAMKQLLEQVKTSLPLDQPGIFSCGPSNNCVGCPKKLLDLVDAEVSYWDAAVAQGVIPSFGDISRFGKLCHNVSRGLKRNNIQTLGPVDLSRLFLQRIVGHYSHLQLRGRDFEV